MFYLTLRAVPLTAATPVPPLTPLAQLIWMSLAFGGVAGARTRGAATFAAGVGVDVGRFVVVTAESAVPAKIMQKNAEGSIVPEGVDSSREDAK